jgi:hypothetical protein
MDPQDVLLTFAEVSVTLAGFIGITAAFRRQESMWSPFDIGSVRFVLEVSFAALFLSIVPAVLVNLSIAETNAWRVAGAIMAVVLIALFAYQSRRRKRIAREVGSPQSLAARPLLIALYLLITIGIAVCSVLDVVVPGMYLVGGGTLLMSAVIEFLAFVAGLQG